MRITTDRPQLKSALSKLGWFVGLWVAGVLAVGSVAMVLRAVLHAGS